MILAEKKTLLDINKLANEILAFLNRTTGNSGAEVPSWLKNRLGDPVLFGNESFILANSGEIAQALSHLLAEGKIQITEFIAVNDNISVLIKPTRS